MGYDTNKKAFRYVLFGSNGRIEENIGQWNEAERVFDWKQVNGPPGITRTSTTRRLKNGAVESHILEKTFERPLPISTDQILEKTSMNWPLVVLFVLAGLGAVGVCLIVAAFVLIARQGGWKLAVQQPIAEGRWPAARRLMVAGASLALIFGLGVVIQYFQVR